MTATLTAPAPPARGTAAPALTAALASGAAVAAQLRLNGELSVALREPLLTALVSFVIGLLVVGALVLARRASRAAVAKVRFVPVLQRLGGLGGAALVAVGAAAAPKIGVALLTVGLVAGQAGGGLVVDRAGWGPGGSHPLTLPRVLGALLCLVAVGTSLLSSTVGAAPPVLLLLVVATGFGVSVQQALNGQVHRTTGDTAVATLVNFAVGTAALGVGVLGYALVAGLDIGTWPGPEQWYLYLGGPLGACFVAVAAVAVRTLGVLRLGLTIIAGQLVGALLLDLLLPIDSSGIELVTVLGVVLTLVAVAVSGRGAGP